MRCTSILLLALAVCATAQQQDSTLDHYSDIARQALAAKKWDDAAQALEHLASLAPDVAEVHANLGLAYFFEGRPSEALASFERARKLNPQLPVLEAMIALSQAELGRCDQALDVLLRVFNRPPDQDTGRLSGLHLLSCYSQSKQPEKALRIGETLRERFPDDPEILYRLSRLHAEISSQLMSALLRNAPDSAWIHYANAQVQESLERPETAAQEYRNALQRDPRMVGVHYKLGRLMLAGSRTSETVEKARSEFQQELSLAPTNADAEYELGEIDREQSRPAEAMAHFEKAVRYHPGFAEAQLGLAKTLLELGRAGDALPHLQQAERLEPQNKTPHYLLASAYKLLGDRDRAEKEFAVYRKIELNTSTAPSQNPDGNVIEQ